MFRLMVVVVVVVTMVVVVGITPGLLVSVGVATETIVADGVDAPIRMTAFPAMETIQPVRITDEPDIAGSEIEILVADETDVFIAVPSVAVRNPDHHFRGHDDRRSLHHHRGRRRIGDDGRRIHHPAGFNDTA
jgi:hypothetical protein